jgi:hypothetical protein
MLIEFQPFLHTKIFPKCTGIIPHIHAIEIHDQGIPYAKVIKICFVTLPQFLSQVPAE